MKTNRKAFTIYITDEERKLIKNASKGIFVYDVQISANSFLRGIIFAVLNTPNLFNQIFKK
jgi:hypothetical protein